MSVESGGGKKASSAISFFSEALQGGVRWFHPSVEWLSVGLWLDSCFCVALWLDLYYSAEWFVRERGKSLI